MSAEAVLSPIAEAVRRSDRDRFESALFAPEPRREALFALYAYHLEIARTPWRVSEPAIGAIRLKWWVEAVGEIYGGGPVRAHWLVDALRDAPRWGAPPALLVDIAESRAADLGPPPRDASALDAYLAGTSGATMRAAAHILTGGAADETDRAAADVGWAMGAAALLRAAPALAARSRAALPGLSGAELEALARGEATPAFRSAAQALAAEASARLTRARGRSIERAATPALLAAWRAGPLLRRAARGINRLAEDLGPESEFRRRANLLARGMLGRW